MCRQYGECGLHQRGTYSTGNVFTAQLSDASGSFAAPTAIGSVTGTASGSINAIIPAGTSGSGYRIRVVASNPLTYGTDNGSNILIGTVPGAPSITATNSSCQAGCTVGGGLFSIGTTCGSGTTLTYYSSAAGANPTTTAPVYNQTAAMTIYYACVDNASSCRSAVQSLTTVPGVCTPPAVPANPSSTSPGCGSVTLTANGTAPNGVTWYWQTSANGTSTTDAGTTYMVSSSGTYYLRAKDNTTGCWSNGAGSAAVTVNAPKIDVAGGSPLANIADGSTSVSVSNGTDFGTGTLSGTYTITNTGSCALSISGITSSNSSEFAISGAPTTVPAQAGSVPGTATFTVTFNPSTTGQRSSTITISSDDADEASYNFVVQATMQGSALSFGGTNNYVDVSSAAAFNIGNNTDLTIEAWVKRTTTSPKRDFFFSHQSPGGAGSQATTRGYQALIESNGKLTFEFADGSLFLTSGNTALTYNVWHHVAITLNRATQTVSFYLDGNFDGSTTNSRFGNNADTNNTPATLIGWERTSNGNLALQGQMDELRIWNTVRSCEDIKHRKDCELAGNQSGLLAYYKFNEGAALSDNTVATGTGTTALADATSHGYNGTLTNFTLTGSSSNWIAQGGVTTGTSCTSYTAPETNVQDGATTPNQIADGSTTASGTNHTDFGSVNPGSGASYTYTIQNTGNAALTISGITKANATGSGDFSISGIPSAIAANSSATFTVTFTPSALGVRSTTIHIASNDCDEGDYSFAIAGTCACATPVAYTVSGGGAYCAGGTGVSIALSNSESGVNYQLHNGTSTVGTAIAGTGSTISFTQTAAGTYTVLATRVDGGCTATMSGNATVTVSPLPTASVTPYSSPLCAGSNALFNITGTTGATVTYNIGGGPNGTLTLSTGSVSPSLANVMSSQTLNLVSITDGTCSQNLGTSATVVVNLMPDVAQPPSQTVCNSSTVAAINFSGSVSGATYSWANNTTSIGLAASGSGNIASFAGVNSGTAPLTATVIVTPSYTSGGTTCTGTAKTFTITVNPTPDVAQPADQVICNNGTTAAINFSGSVSGTTYNWVNSDPAIGLATSGAGNIAAFAAVNNTSSPITSSITVTPSFGGSPFAYIADRIDNTISVVNAATNSIVNTFSAGNNPAGTAISPNGSRLYVTNFSGNDVSVYNTATNALVSTISVGSVPFGVAVNPGGNRVYVANRASGNVSVIDATTNSLISNVSTGSGPYGVAVNPGGSRIYVTNSGSNNVSVIDAASNSVLSTISTGNGGYPEGIVFNPAGTRAFVANYMGGTVAVIDASTNTVASTITVGSLPEGITINPAGSRVYVANQGSATVSVIDVATNAVISTVNVGNGPTGISVDPSGAKIFVTNQGSGTLSVIDAATNIVTSTITVGSAPYSFGNFITPTSGCGGTTKTFNITVNPTPTATATHAAQSVCNGTPITAIALTGNVAGTTYSWTRDNTSSVTGMTAGGSGTSISGSLTNTTSAPVTVFFTITPSYTNAGQTCTGVPITATVVVNPTPDVAQPAALTVCNNSVTGVSFMGSVAGTLYKWINTTPGIGLAASGTGNIVGFTANNTSYVPVTATVTVTPSVGGSHAYIPNYNSNTVSVVNIASRTIAATINVGTHPYGVAVMPDASKVYIGNSGSSSVSVINPASNTIAATISVGTQPEGIAISPDGSKAYVANGGSNTVSVINTASNAIAATVNVGTHPYGISVTPDGNKVYVVNSGSNNVSVINAATNTVASTVTVGTNPQGIATSPDGSKVYVANNNSSSVSVISTVNNTVSNSINVGSFPRGIAITPDGNKIYVANQGSNSVSVINPLTNAVVGTIATGSPWGISISPDGSNAYVANNLSNTISVINTASNTVATTVSVGNDPLALGNFITAGTACTGTSKSFAITVNPTPDVAASPASQTVCSGTSISGIVLSGNVSGTTYSWTRDNTTSVTGIAANGTGTSIAGTLTNTSGAPVTVSFTITPGYTNAGSTCTGTPFIATVTVNPEPAAPANPVSNSPQCASLGVTITAAGTAPAGFTWYWQGTNSTGTSNTADAATSYNATASGTYYIRANNNLTGCWSTGSGSVAVIVNPFGITTVAGTGSSGYNDDSIAATAAKIYNPGGVAFNSTGDMYIADFNNHRIRKVSISTGEITTVAGTGISGYSGDNGAATSAKIQNPTGLAVDGSGNIYIADFNNNRIRKVNASNGVITTIAGNGTAAYGGGNGTPTSASLNHATGVALDAAGNIYIADRDNNRIRKINVATGYITTIAGTGTAGFSGDNGPATAAKISAPNTVALDASGNVYIADRDNNRVRKIDAATGYITTIAGTGTAGFSGDNGLATAAKLDAPNGVALDASGNLYIADRGNNRIRKVAATGGIISTVAGTGAAGYNGDNIVATAASLYTPAGVAVNASGYLYIADEYNHRIRAVLPYIAPSVPAVSSTSNAICNGSSATLSITSGALNDAAGWKWYTGTCGGTLVGTGTSITVAPTATTTYYVRGEGGCVTIPGSCGAVTVIVNPLPVATATPSSQNRCTGVPIIPIVLTSTATGTAYTWTRNNTGTVTGMGAAGSGSTISGSLTASGTLTTTFTITPTFTNAGKTCTGASIPATVTVVPNTLSATSSVSPLYPMSGQKIQTIFLNYPGSRQYDSVRMTPAGGTIPYAYSFTMSGCNNTVYGASFPSAGPYYIFSPDTSKICNGNGDNIFTFVPTVTDINGCKANAPIKRINVVNPYKGDSVLVCHKVATRGSISYQLNTVPASQASTYTNAGDQLGNCATFTGRTGDTHGAEEETPAPITGNEALFSVYPNPSTGVFTVGLSVIESGADITITDVQGRLVASRFVAAGSRLKAYFDLNMVSRGLYMVSVKDGDRLYRAKLVLQ